MSTSVWLAESLLEKRLYFLWHVMTTEKEIENTRTPADASIPDQHDYAPGKQSSPGDHAMMKIESTRPSGETRLDMETVVGGGVSLSRAMAVRAALSALLVTGSTGFSRPRA